jgi:aubergine-like protein
MICGIDTYHDPSRKGCSIAGFVASLNMPPTRWFSKISKQSEGKELVEGLTTSLLSALTKYHEVKCC